MKAKTHMKRTFRPHWTLLWLMQFAAMMAVSLLVALSYWLGGTLHAILIWCILPAAGLLSAYLVTRHGLLNYAAWIAPPAAGALGHYLIWTYMPSAGPILLCAFLSLVGAAAGEVIKRQKKDAD